MRWRLIICLILVFAGKNVDGEQRVSAEEAGNTQIAGHRVERTLVPSKTTLNLVLVNCIFQDESGLYWFGHELGLASYDEGRNQWKTFSKKAGQLSGYEVTNVAQSADGRLWFSSNMPTSRHLTSLADERWSRVDRAWGSQSLTPLTAMFSARAKGVWFAVDQTLFLYSKEGWSLPLAIPERLGRSNTAPLDQNDVSNLGTEWPAYPEDFQIVAGLEDHRGCVWLSTGAGIIRFNEQERGWKIVPNKRLRGTVMQIYEDRKGRIWFANEYGDVCRYDPDADAWSNFHLPEELEPGTEKRASKSIAGAGLLEVNAIYQDQRGLVMFATGRGLVTFDETEHIWRTITSDNAPLPANAITTILEDRSGRIWVATVKGFVVLAP